MKLFLPCFLREGYIRKLNPKASNPDNQYEILGISEVSITFSWPFTEEYMKYGITEGCYNDAVENLKSLQRQKIDWLKIFYSFYFGRCYEVDITILNYEENAEKAQELLPQFLIKFDYKNFFKYHDKYGNHYTEAMKGFVH